MVQTQCHENLILYSRGSRKKWITDGSFTELYAVEYRINRIKQGDIKVCMYFMPVISVIFVIFVIFVDYAAK
jgi:hypothetical protein